MPLATINAVWIGPTLGAIHTACLRSFVRQGHRTVLHVYERPTDIPDGVELKDARNLLPESRIIRYRSSGSPAIFSNLLRYEILKQGLGLYVDCDCYCLSPIEDASYIFGWEDDRYINNAVLKLPQDCPTLAKLAAIKDSQFFQTPWASFKRRSYHRARAWINKPLKIEDMPWGYTGPRALTWHLTSQGLVNYGLPIDAFYPVHHDHVSLLMDSNLTISDITTPRTVLLHLWNDRLKHLDLSEIQPFCPLGEILRS